MILLFLQKQQIQNGLLQNGATWTPLARFKYNHKIKQSKKQVQHLPQKFLIFEMKYCTCFNFRKVEIVSLYRLKVGQHIL